MQAAYGRTRRVRHVRNTEGDSSRKGLSQKMLQETDSHDGITGEDSEQAQQCHANLSVL